MRQKRSHSVSDRLLTVVRLLAGLLAPVLVLAGLVLALSFVWLFVNVLLLSFGGWGTIEVAITFAMALAAAGSIRAGIVLLGVARGVHISVKVDLARGQRLNRSDTAVVLAGPIVAAVALLGVMNFLAGIREHGRIAGMKSDLRGLAGAEREYFDSHQRFTDDLAALDFQSGPSVQVVVQMADSIGWRATASAEDSRYTCSLSFRGGAEEASPRQLTCTK